MESIIPWVVMLPLIIAWILLFFINIKTVRRLRKNPITRDELGSHLIWGWYAITISQAVFFSKQWTTTRKNRPNGFMFANKDLVEQHITPFEKILCKLLVSFGLFFLVCMFIVIAWDGVEYLMDLVD